MKQIKTKHTPLRRPQWALMAIAATLAAAGILACTPEEEHVTRNRPIVLNAVTKGVVDGGTDMTLHYAFAHETSAGTYASYNGAYTGTRSAGTGVQPLTPYSLVLKYNIGGLKTKITGWHPGGGTAADVTTSGNGYYNTAAKTVTWTINGTQDIIVSAAKEGSVASPIPPLVFEHCLTQILFHPYAETQSAIDAWGKITRIEVVNQQNTVQYSLIDNDATGAVTFTGTANKTITSTGIPTGGAALSLSSIANKETKALRMGDPMMIAPKATGNNITLNIFTDKKEKKTLTLNRELKAGTPYRLYLRFTERDITIEASVVNDWVGVTTDDKLGNMRVGDYYYTDGTVSPKLESGNGKTANGVVYYIDPNDQRKFKVMALDGSASTDRPVWSGKVTYVIGVDARSNANGRGNSDAIKAYFDANKGAGVSESTFAQAFPTPARCYNYTGKGNSDAPGTWHLPARNELQYMYCAFNGSDPVIWESGSTGAPAKNSGPRSTWNTRLTAAGGRAMEITQYVWSSTENSNSDVKSMRFNDGLLVTSNKNNQYPNCYRCVRDIN